MLKVKNTSSDMGKAPVYIKSRLVKAGTMIEDIKKKQWVVGSVLGQGGFGAIYTAQELNSNAFNNVMKLEPVSNGPLYTEINFYKRVCGEKEIVSWMNERKLKFLGIPRYISDGLLADTDRFLIMDRYGDDLHKLLMMTSLSHKCIFQIAINMLDVLEYIHSRDYSHADIKALNILQGYKSPKEVYLLDFGMVTKFIHNGIHKPEKVDNKIKHNGTLEFCPRDSHRGLVSCRRSDVESLMFNLVFWLTWDRNCANPSPRVGYGNLPWLSFMKNIGDKPPSLAVLKQVADSKEKFMENPKMFVESVNLGTHSWSHHLVDVLTSVSGLRYTEVPNYGDIRKKFATIICMIGGKPATSSVLSNLEPFRNIQWPTNTPANRRKSNMGTQVTPPKLGGRKRGSSDNKDVNYSPGPSLKKSKKIVERKKKVPEVNNSCAREEIDQMFSSIDGQVDFNVSDSLSEANNTADDLRSKIPKSAFLSQKARGGLKNGPVEQKENIKGRRVVKQPKSTAKTLLTETNVATVASSSATTNDVIPGVKSLNRLKEKGGVPTRSSPRITAQKKEQPHLLSRANAHRSVSCQTSP